MQHVGRLPPHPGGSGRTREASVDRYNPFYGVKYQIAFPGNPGILRAPEIDIYLDGSRPTLYTTRAPRALCSSRVSQRLPGRASPVLDHKCRRGPDAAHTARHSNRRSGLHLGIHLFRGLSSLETRLLQRCLGEADLNPNTYSASGTIEGHAYTWDYGDVYYPHVVRLVDRTDPYEIITDLCNLHF